MTDSTEEVRRALVPTMPAELAAAIERGEEIWTTAELQADFRVLGFAAPFVIVERRGDGVKGTLTFTHSPRHYFGWKPDLT